MAVAKGSARKGSRAPAVAQGGRPNAAQSAPIVGVLSRIRSQAASLPTTARRIADFIAKHPEAVMGMSVTELAEATGASEGSVINFCRQLQMTGFQQLKLSLAQDLVQPVQFIHEDLQKQDDIETVCRKVFHAGVQALRDTLSVLDARAMARAVQAIRSADRIEIYGIGSSAPIAEDAHYRMLRIGLEAKVVIDSHVQAISASKTGPKVAVLTISHSGATHETLLSTKLARQAGARTICITNYGRSPIQAYADIVLYTMARETTFRTEAMTSRIAQLCVVDALIAALALADYDRAVDTLQQTFEVLASKRV
ncbi:MAG: MurR/RpiR family transcriptional regulator [Gammaproteobacteria bacterium]